MATYGYKPPKPPGPAQLSDSAYRTFRQTSGYQDPFPSLSANGRNTQLPKLTGSMTTPTAKAKPPAATPQVQQQAGQKGAPNAPVTPQVGYSYDADPILNQIQALSTQGREQATSQAHGLRRQVAQQYGDPELARKYGGEEDALAAQQNPNSVLAQLAKSYQTGQQGLEEGLNQANLFYSGARVKQLGDLASQYQTQQYQAGQDEQGALGGIEASLASALAAADQRDLAAQQDAYARQLQAALAAGGVGEGYPTDIGGDMGDVGGAGVAASQIYPNPSGSIPNIMSAIQSAAAAQQNYNPDDIAEALGLAPPPRRRAGQTAQGFRGIL